MLDPKKVANSICKIETELCFLHGLLAAEEHGVSALQSGEAPSQRLKAEIAALVTEFESKADFYGRVSAKKLFIKLRQLSAV